MEGNGAMARPLIAITFSSSHRDGPQRRPVRLLALHLGERRGRPAEIWFGDHQGRDAVCRGPDPKAAVRGLARLNNPDSIHGHRGQVPLRRFSKEVFAFVPADSRSAPSIVASR